ncbi:ATP-binding protein [Daejeonella sp.]|uniref:ATP-binding protein n=1 Tax=Daejeonella sp. TaxID=2805397 RepID=UPI0039831FFF
MPGGYRENAKKPSSRAVSFSDKGIGINAENVEHIFDRYYRVETNHTQHISGFGIGLYLSAEIIKRHGGKKEQFHCNKIFFSSVNQLFYSSSIFLLLQ